MSKKALLIAGALCALMSLASVWFGAWLLQMFPFSSGYSFPAFLTGAALVVFFGVCATGFISEGMDK